MEKKKTTLSETPNQSGEGSELAELLTRPMFTDGPWAVRAGTFCEDGIPSYEVVMPGPPQLNAVDARLISAAPMLFKALRTIYRDSFIDCGCECDTEMCCVQIGRPCAKCTARAALSLVFKPVTKTA